MTGKNSLQKKTPKVSIIAISYNHEKYIRQAFDSFLMQKTNFNFEIVVGDDHSTDGTQQIINEYLSKYPDTFRQIKREKNIGLQRNFADTMNHANGEYLALCECDDYWTDSKKLQKQVDFLDDNPSYALCFHPVSVTFEDNSKKSEVYPPQGEKQDYSIKKLLEQNFIQTNSVVYKKQNYDSLPTDILPIDWFLHLYHAQFGKIGFINEVMSVYRRHPGGIWWSQHKKPELIWEKYGYNYLKLLHEIMLMYGKDPENKKIINHHIAGSFEAIASLKSQGIADNAAVRSIGEMPSETWDYVKHLMQQVDHYSKHDAYLEGVLKSETLRHEDENAQNDHKIKQLNDELNGITTSNAWKAVSKVRLGKHYAKHPIKGVRHVARHVRARVKR